MQINIYSILLFPEIILSVGTLFILLLSQITKILNFRIISYLSILLLFVTIILIYNNKYIDLASYHIFFTNSLLIQFFKILVIFGTIFTIFISINFFEDLRLNKIEIPILFLFSSLGLIIMVSSNNLMSMYLGIELQSLSLYVLTAIKRDSIKSSESGVKYFVLGALSSGILLYGCSLLYGYTGSSNFYDIKLFIIQLNNLNLGITFSLVFILVGLAFKISAVPFHMWTPDVYEGSPSGVTAFFAIVPKIAGLVLTYRFCIEIFYEFLNDWRMIIILLSVLSMFLGSIAAISQNNIKRLLAYSTIGHVGYMLIGLASANTEGISGLIIYITIYLIMNIAIFAFILSIKIHDRYIEKLSDLSGISKKNPIVSISICIIMFSLAGIPPFAGFFGKFYIFVAALNANLLFLAILGVIASVISSYYYLKIIKIMYFEESNIIHELNMTKSTRFIVFISILFISFFIIYPNFLTGISKSISFSYFNLL